MSNNVNLMAAMAVTPATQNRQSKPTSWFEVMAEAWGKTLDAKANEIETAADDLAGGKACVALGWAGDMNIARGRALENKSGNDIEVLLPSTGGLIFMAGVVGTIGWHIWKARRAG